AVPGASAIKFDSSVGQRAAGLLGLKLATAFGPAQAAWAVALALLLVAALAVGLARRLPGNATLGALAIAFLALDLAVPGEVGAGGFLNHRLELFLLLFVAAAGTGPSGGGLRVLAPALVSGLTLAQLLFLSGVFLDFREDMRAYLSGVAYVPKGAPL